MSGGSVWSYLEDRGVAEVALLRGEGVEDSAELALLGRRGGFGRAEGDEVRGLLRGGGGADWSGGGRGRAFGVGGLRGGGARGVEVVEEVLFALEDDGLGGGGLPGAREHAPLRYLFCHLFKMTCLRLWCAPSLSLPQVEPIQRHLLHRLLHLRPRRRQNHGRGPQRCAPRFPWRLHPRSQCTLRQPACPVRPTHERVPPRHHQLLHPRHLRHQYAPSPSLTPAIILGAAGDFIFRVLPLVIYVMPLHAYCLLTCEALLFSPSLHPPSGLLSHPLLLPSTYLRVARDPALSKKAECLL